MFQEYKVVYKGTDIFFFAHSLRSARYHMLKCVNSLRAKGEKCKVYCLNYSNFGEKWIPDMDIS